MLESKGKYYLLQHEDQNYMCAYLGINSDMLGNYYVNFLINGVQHVIILNEDDVRELSGCETLSTDKCTDLLDQEISADPTEYVECWEVCD